VLYCCAVVQGPKKTVRMNYANEVKLFGKWSYEGVSLGDISLEDFIAVKPKDMVYLPHTGACIGAFCRLMQVPPAA